MRELSQDPGAAEPVKRSPLPVGACLYFHSRLYQTFSHWMKTPRQPEWLSPSDAEFSQNSHCCQGRREFSLLPRLSWAFGNRHFCFPVAVDEALHLPSSKALLPQAASPEVASVPPGSL
ncbi:hypothetical protein ACRRTK_022007 [Alexandromys fortis]